MPEGEVTGKTLAVIYPLSSESGKNVCCTFKSTLKKREGNTNMIMFIN
jgi:hypothetical protein